MSTHEIVVRVPVDLPGTKIPEHALLDIVTSLLDRAPSERPRMTLVAEPVAGQHHDPMWNEIATWVATWASEAGQPVSWGSLRRLLARAPEGKSELGQRYRAYVEALYALDLGALRDKLHDEVLDTRTRVGPTREAYWQRAGGPQADWSTIIDIYLACKLQPRIGLNHTISQFSTRWH